MGNGTTLEHCVLTDRGRRRAANQDSTGVFKPGTPDQYWWKGWLFVVADGMGAHAAGEQASALATEEVVRHHESSTTRSPPLALRTAIERANAAIHARGESDPDVRGMGTTCTALVIVPRGALVGHVGDSRAYRVRRGSIEQLSRDHSLAWDAEAHRVAGGDDQVPIPPRNIITRSLGPHPQVDVDLEGPTPVEAGDVFVLCSDGLSGQVDDAEIGLFAGSLPPPRAAEALLGLALVRGGPDNVTLAVIRAGKDEESTTAVDDKPWPLAEPPPAREPRPVPWRLLTVSAASLLACLMVNPWSPLVVPASQEGAALLDALLGSDLAAVVGTIVGATAALTCVAALSAAIVSVTNADEQPVEQLRPGARLGGGPYRSAECRPSTPLLDRVVQSVESPVDDADDRLAALVAEARRRLSDGDLGGALDVTADAIAIRSGRAPGTTA